MRILVIDDSFVSRAQIKALFVAYGDVDSASTGKLGLDLFEQAHVDGEPYSLIALDVDLPDLTGHEVLGRLRHWEERARADGKLASAKVVMISALGDGKSIMSAFTRGCEAYLVKPVTPERIAAALREVELA